MKEIIRKLLLDWNLPHWAWNMILLGTAILLGYLLRILLRSVAKKYTKDSGDYSLFSSLLQHLRHPAALFLPVFLLTILLPFMQMPQVLMNRVSKGVEIAFIVSFAWVLIRIMAVVQDYIIYRYDFKKTNNLRERKIRTQLIYVRQVLTGFIILITIAAILLSFSAMRRIGAGLLTGVGIGGIVVGFAAQRSLANLLAGFQIAFTQPIRIDDVVVVEGEWGRVEEITLTYVVIHIWDERRLVLPITYFIEKPFQNWTRRSAALIGTVMVYADYNLPVEPLRTELNRLVKGHPLWDGRVVNLAVTETDSNVMGIRALVSAATSSETFDLRCFVREGLIRFLATNYPDSLPKARVELDGPKQSETQNPDPLTA